MLDTDTKRRIDTARDILVGKVPDPKSQVEQITIALIYKFMDDLDAESEELGGERTFFAGEFARYGWAKLMQPGIGGHDMLSLYADAIIRMPENPGIPPLFREIFNNAFLPYRDPETLRAFLKVINEFTYDHSERLGDAFEYLLSVLGAQGDAGQFRTPRHIIDFIVAVVDPKKDETILDPACGTAGFLISAYKHVLAANTNGDGQSTLTPDDRGRLVSNFKGYDISPDMVRLSLVNMYLHGFREPRIHEYDTLTSEERWNEYADVILANPPFMSPKGGIRPHNRFSVKSRRSEVLFVDYMAEHLTANGRAGIIVPEGIIFQSQRAYRQLRKMLVEDYLVAVASLPAGVFNPYSGVKTSVLFLDRALAKRTDGIAFFKVEHDGFDLGAQRRPIGQDDLPSVQAELGEYLRRLQVGESVDDFRLALGMVVERERVAADGEYNLSGERYRDASSGSSEFPMVPLGQVAKFIRGITFRKADQLERETEDSLPVVTTRAAQEAGIVEEALYYIPRSLLKDDTKLLQPGDILISTANSLRLLGRTTHVQAVDRPVSFGAFMSVIRPDSCILDTYLTCCLRTEFAAEFFVRNANTTTSISNLNLNTLAEFQIPLPPLEVQREIVEEIEGYQRVIDGARAVVENYRPRIAVAPEWPMVALRDVCSLISGQHVNQEDYNTACAGVGYLTGPADFGVRYTTFSKWTTKPKVMANKGDILIAVKGSGLGKVNLLGADTAAIGRQLMAIRAVGAVPEYIYGHLSGMYDHIQSLGGGAAIPGITRSDVLGLKIPLPTLAEQEATVAEMEAERAIVDSNRELILRFERKIQEAVSRVWGSAAPTPS